jgi:hypothetical protein
MSLRWESGDNHALFYYAEVEVNNWQSRAEIAVYISAPLRSV